eukprot:m.147225 g.147225  ORF g.147225 m.147225 type:complete len:520 (+) comp24346_c0_seq1:256-1815(+)
MMALQLSFWCLFSISCVLAGEPINPRHLSFSSYIGPVVNLTFSDPSVLRVAKILNPGSLRYPGGSIANSWNISTGRWVPSVQDIYANRTDAFPIGTFTPAKYMDGIGSLLHVPPIWNLNVVTLSPEHMVSQLDWLAEMKVPVAYLELGNEKAGGCANPSYLQRVGPVVQRARQLFPNAKIAIIGNWASPQSGPPNWTKCAQALAQHRHLFDAVTVHQYQPMNETIMAQPPSLRRTATLGFAWPLLRFHANIVNETMKDTAGGTPPIWLDEFNWGGSWGGSPTWANETHGGLRGLLLASFLINGMSLGSHVYDSLNYYSLFYQSSSDWSKWASCASVPNSLNAAHEVAFDGVAQVFAHFTNVALNSGFDTVDALPHLNTSALVPTTLIDRKDVPCLQGVAFSSSSPSTDHQGNKTNNLLKKQQKQTASQPYPQMIVLNVCSSKVAGTLPGNPKAVLMHAYSAQPGRNAGGWVLADEISNLFNPPWEGGPLNVTTKTVSMSMGAALDFEALSLTFVEIVEG